MKDPIPFGKYLLQERVDVGGMAEVFVAGGPDGRRCAVKRLLPGLSEDPELLAMFLDEARLTARLAHPGIVEVRDLGRVGESWYIAMEYVPGADLAALLARLRPLGRPLPVAVSAWVAREVARALDFAHRSRDAVGTLRGVVHGDVSPQNVLVSFGGQVKLIDFGLARRAAAAAPAGAVGSAAGAGALPPGPARVPERVPLRGKIGYMSPEQAEGRNPDRRSDVFALGAVLHEMLAGERLFRGESELAVLERIRSGPVAPPSQANAEVPPELDRAVLRALAHDPKARFAWASELADALGPVADPNGAVALSEVVRAVLPEEWERERSAPGGSGA